MAKRDIIHVVKYGQTATTGTTQEIVNLFDMAGADLGDSLTIIRVIGTISCLNMNAGIQTLFLLLFKDKSDVGATILSSGTGNNIINPSDAENIIFNGCCSSMNNDQNNSVVFNIDLKGKRTLDVDDTLDLILAGSHANGWTVNWNLKFMLKSA